MDIKLFDETNGGGWPPGGIIYVVPYGTTKVMDISCIAGAKVCFGGADHNTGTLYWGASLANNKDCAACCATCGQGDTVLQNLTCQ